MLLSERIETFRESIESSSFVLDPPDVHHEFVSDMHGRKLDFDKIETGTELYKEWVGLNAQFIEETFVDLPSVLLGVAKGTNRLALDVARRFEGKMIGLVSEKDPDNNKRLLLGKFATKVVNSLEPKHVVVVEDVGTTGSNSVQVATSALDAGARKVTVVTTWKRREKLERLEEAGIPHLAIIDKPLATYSPEDCVDHGYCAQGADFIPLDN